MTTVEYEIGDIVEFLAGPEGLVQVRVGAKEADINRTGLPGFIGQALDVDEMSAWDCVGLDQEIIRVIKKEA